MGFLKNIAKKAGCRAARNELDALKSAVDEFPKRSVGGIFQAAANLRGGLSQSLPHPYNVAFAVAVGSTRSDLQDKAKLREGVAKLLPVLTDLQRDTDDIITKWAVNFWRVVFMSMLHDELFDEGRELWLIVQRIEGERADTLDDEDDESILYCRRPLYYFTS
jgi:hypothetical protein